METSQVRLRISTLGGSCFQLDVDSSCYGHDVKQLLVNQQAAPTITSMRLWYGHQELLDKSVIGSIIQSTSEANLTMLRRSIACEEFIIAARNPYFLDSDCEMNYMSDHIRQMCEDDLEVQSNKECVLTAISEFHLSLESASPDLRSDRDIVKAALAQNPLALEFASSDLRDDKGIVMGAVTKDGRALEFAGDRCRHDSMFLWQRFSVDHVWMILTQQSIFCTLEQHCFKKWLRSDGL